MKAGEVIQTRRIFDEIQMNLSDENIQGLSDEVAAIFDEFGSTIKKFTGFRMSLHQNDLLKLLSLMPNLEELHLKSVRGSHELEQLGDIEAPINVQLPRLKYFKMTCSSFDFLADLECPVLEKFYIFVGSEGSSYEAINFILRCNQLEDVNIDQQLIDTQNPFSLNHLRLGKLKLSLPDGLMLNSMLPILQGQDNLRSISLLLPDKVDNMALRRIVSFTRLETLEIYVGEHVCTDLAYKILDLKNLKVLRIQSYANFIGVLTNAKNHQLEELSTVSFDGLPENFTQSLPVSFPNMKILSLCCISIEELLTLASRLKCLESLDMRGCQYPRNCKFEMPNKNLNVQELLISGLTFNQNSFHLIKTIAKVLPNVEILAISETDSFTPALLMNTILEFKSLKQFHSCAKRISSNRIANFIKSSDLRKIVVDFDCFSTDKAMKKFVEKYSDSFPLVKDNIRYNCLIMSRI